MLDKLDIDHEVLNAKFHEREAHIVANAGEVNAVTVATNMAGRGTDIPLGKGATEVGGLYVIGTERHEARRIDNQLRGRSGRQGDPGLTRFFAALDDQIMRIQGGDIVKRIMDMTNLPDEVPIESRMVTSSIERAQKRMEGMYFDSRKHVVEYDDVVNQQREIFYTRRLRHLELVAEFEDLYNQEIDPEVRKQGLAKAKLNLINEYKEAISSQAQELVAVFTLEEGNLEHKINQVINTLLSIGDNSLFVNTANELKLYKEPIATSEQLIEVLSNQWRELVDKPEQLTEFLNNFLRMAITIKLEGINNYAGLVRAIFLDVMDELWTLHLDFMQDVREGIGLRGVAQLDPLVEYKNEGFKAFREFISKVNRQSLFSILQVREVSAVQRPEPVEIKTNETAIAEPLTGDREILQEVLAKATSRKSDPIPSNDAEGSMMTRKERRKIERANKKKKK
jgi:preprotein translocase subunit SecA